MIAYFFYFLSTLLLFSAMMVIVAKNPVHCILFLILSFFCLSSIYIFMLNAQFVGIVNIIVYAGAIMVLFLHTVMFVNWSTEGGEQGSKYVQLTGIIVAGIFLTVVTAALKIVSNRLPNGPLILNRLDMGMVKNLGRVLFKQFLLPFEVTSVLFFAAIVGAILLAKKEVA